MNWQFWKHFPIPNFPIFHSHSEGGSNIYRMTSNFWFKLFVSKWTRIVRKNNNLRIYCTLNSAERLIRRIKDLVYKFYKMKIFSGMIVFIILGNIFNGSTSKYHYWGKCIEFHFHNLDGAIQIIMPKKYNVNSTIP